MPEWIGGFEPWIRNYQKVFWTSITWDHGMELHMVIDDALEVFNASNRLEF